ncbi:MAG TPA: hypothetical protein VJV77_02980 [Casimicrobiaceae bacterium]|nr:hypothetical protein [Casimicrobiaceae bacterium]
MSAASLIDAVEYYYAGLDHYFVTAAPGEIAKLDAGALPGWLRTDLSFKVFDPVAKVAEVSPVCRAYGKAEAGLNSHFYSASPTECAELRARFGDSWLVETDNAFGVWLPDPQTGQCPAASTPVYRSWNNRLDSNHRFTTDPVVHRTMIERGYVAEGYGPAAMPVAMCAPLDASNLTAPVCVALASESAPAPGTQVVLTAYCSNAPDRYRWNGCSSSTATCRTTSTASAPAAYAVTASNAAGASVPATVIVAWGSTTTDGTISPTGSVPVFTPQRDANGVVTNYDTLPLRAWYEIADTRMIKLLPQLPQSNADDMNNVMANWGSSANDPATGDMHLHGGAHGANGENNGFYTFNTRRADWRVTVPPLYMGPVEKAYLDKAAKLYRPDATYSGSWNIGMPPDFMFLPVPGSVRGDPTIDTPNADSSGRVYAHHSWHKFVWVEWMQRAFVSLIHMYFLDPATGKVTLGQAFNDTDWQYNTADPVTKRIYGLTRAFSYNDYWDFREYDPVADKIIADYPLDLDPPDKYYFNLNNIRVVVNREIVSYNPQTKVWFAFHMDNKTWRALFWGEIPSVSGAGEISAVYVPGIGVLACQAWGRLYRVDTASGEVSEFPVTGPAQFGSRPTNGLFDRLNLQGNLLFAIDWATSNVKVMRMQ